MPIFSSASPWQSPSCICGWDCFWHMSKLRPHILLQPQLCSPQTAPSGIPRDKAVQPGLEGRPPAISHAVGCDGGY